jgi:hypothetical protein
VARWDNRSGKVNLEDYQSSQASSTETTQSPDEVATNNAEDKYQDHK